MNHRIALSLLAVAAAFVASLPAMAKSGPDDGLKVAIIRHGEKPKDGDNLSCQGENRALQLPGVLYKKFNKPAYTYVPSLSMGDATKHSRMFQTVSPFAIKYNLTVNSQFDEKDSKGIARDVMKKTGTVLLVWEHSAIPDLAQKLGIENPPDWQGSDFDSIWVITYSKGKASLSQDKEGLNPSADCNF